MKYRLVKPNLKLLNVAELETEIQNCRNSGNKLYSFVDTDATKTALIIRYLKESGYNIHRSRQLLATLISVKL